MFKICLIGCGYMTRDGHGPSCAQYARTHEDVELTACCDINPEAAEATRQKFGFQRAYTDYIEMAEKESPNVILAITPVALTAEVSIELLDRKIPVFLEKPPGMDGEQTMAIHEAAIRNNTPARVAFNRRYMPLVRALKEELAEIGQPVLDVDCMFVRSGRTDADFSTTAIHAIDLVSHLAGSEYQTVNFLYQDIMFKDKPVVNTKMSAVMKNGATASLTFQPCGGCVVERITVTLPGYTMFLELPVWGGMDAPGRLVCTKGRTAYKTICGDHETMHESNGFYDESRLFFEALQAGEHPASDVVTGADGVVIAQHIRQRKDKYTKG